MRKTPFDAVIGIGGTGDEAEAHGISFKINWLGTGSRRTKPDPEMFPRWRGPLVTFKYFLLFEDKGVDFWSVAPTLARRMYAACPPRFVFDDFNKTEQSEVARLLKMAKTAPPSTRMPQRSNKGGGSKCC
jgi:hypothetical protein